MTFFASAFNTKTNCPLDSQHSDLEDRDESSMKTPIIQDKIISDLLHDLGTHNFKGLNRIIEI